MSSPLVHPPRPLTSALALGGRPALRCTGGGFSPVSRGKARGSFPVSSCRGHSLVAGGRPNLSPFPPPKPCTTRRHLRKLLEVSIKSTLVPRLRSVCVPNVPHLQQLMSQSKKLQRKALIGGAWSGQQVAITTDNSRCWRENKQPVMAVGGGLTASCRQTCLSSPTLELSRASRACFLS